MEPSNLNMILAAACLVAGIGLGALGYHLLNGGARSAQRMRLKLTERERQLTEWKHGVDEHLQRMEQLTQKVCQDAQALNRQLHDSAQQLGSTAISQENTVQPTAAAEEDLSIPRDYADGNRGTLSEDFGLRSANEDEPRPPRF
ncbi:YhcB family protein [Halomonas denitrificans]|uniref:YhcB family protein n=1 Tax=Halomonas denitrificans TaxID=370769 RepID=UPI001C991C43|nr:DUF1043 family protein [Halomonas denitrificans]MBY5969340.1 YhcB family protein [Halomonas denitrificans]